MVNRQEEDHIRRTHRRAMRRRRRRRAGLHFAYLLRCGDGTFYAGYTVDPVRRTASHGRGRASRYTRGRRPVTLAALWRCPTKGGALRLERMLKKLSHERKVRLARGCRLVKVLPLAQALGACRIGSD